MIGINCSFDENNDDNSTDDDNDETNFYDACGSCSKLSIIP